VLDRYLARTGFDSQQTDQPRRPDRPVNLWEPVDEHGDRGTHGRFDDRSTARSPQLWASQHHRTVATATLGIAGAAVVALVRYRASRLR
jgi:hypothetical protein